MDVGIGFVVHEDGSSDHGAKEAVKVQVFPILLDTLDAGGKRLCTGLLERVSERVRGQERTSCRMRIVASILPAVLIWSQ